MDLGVTVVDMGGGTTGFAVFYDGNVVHTDSIPIGGHHVTTDIARGLSTPVLAAERIKTLYGSALPSPPDDQENNDVPTIRAEEHAQPHHVAKSPVVGHVRTGQRENVRPGRLRRGWSGE